MRSRTDVALAVSLFALFAAGCGGSEVRIGAILPLSGPGEIYGQSARKGIELAIDQVNAQGGVRGKNLAVLIRDSKSLTSAGLEQAMELIDEEEVPAIIGELLSEITLEVATLAERKQVVLLSPASSVPKLTQAGLYVFRNYPSDALEGAQVAQFASEKARLLDMVVVAVSNAYGQGLKESFLRYYTGANREVHKVINFQDGSPDVASIASQIEEVRPDGVYLIAYAPDRRIIVEELRRRGVAARLIGTRDSRDIILAAGEAAEGMIFPLDDYDAASADPAVQEFVKAYGAKFGGEIPGLWAAQAYDAARMLAQALQEAEGLYGQAVQNRLSALEGFRGVTGLIDLDANGDVARRPAIYVVQGGRFIPYDQLESGQAPEPAPEGPS